MAIYSEKRPFLLQLVSVYVILLLKSVKVLKRSGRNALFDRRRITWAAVDNHH